MLMSIKPTIFMEIMINSFCLKHKNSINSFAKQLIFFLSMILVDMLFTNK